MFAGRKPGIMVIVLIVSAFIIGCGIAHSITINSCSYLDQPNNVYILNNSIYNSSSAACIYITHSNITLDCAGNTINGNSSAEYGILVYNSTHQLSNITIKNCRINNWNNNIYFTKVNNVYVDNCSSTKGERGLFADMTYNSYINNSFFSTNTEGLFLRSAQNNIIENTISFNNTQDGIVLYNADKNTIINTKSYANHNGLSLSLSSGNTLTNSGFFNNTAYDVDVVIGSRNDCNNLLINVNGTNNRPLLLLNSTSYITKKNLSELIICGADATISDIFIDNYPFYNNGILLISSNNSLLNKSTILNSYTGIKIENSHSVSLEGLVIANNSQNGVLLFHSTNATITNSRFINNTHGIELINSNYSLFALLNFSSNTIAIDVYSKSYNNIISNCLVEGGNRGISLGPNCMYNLINKSVIKDNNNGLFFSNTANNTVTLSSIGPEKFNGVYFSGESSHNLIYNNIFNTTSYAHFNNPLPNQWNTSSVPAPNIIKGSFIGGNYYTNPSGSGYSDICEDKNIDGFCDVAFALGQNNTDYLPLHAPLDFNITHCSVISRSGSYKVIKDINGSLITHCINIVANNVTLDCQWHTILGGSNSNYGIYVYRDISQDTNITIKNCIVKKWWGSPNIYFYNSHKNKLLNIITSQGNEGIRLYSSNNNYFRNITAYNNNFQGVYLYYSLNNQLYDITSFNNSEGIEIEQAKNNSIYNSRSFFNREFDFNLVLYSQEYCYNKLINLTSLNNRKIELYTNSTNLENKVLAELILCNADNTTLNNISVVGANNNMLGVHYTSHALFNHLNISNDLYGIYFHNSNNITVANSFIENNKYYGVYVNSNYQNYPLRFYNNIFINNNNTNISGAIYRNNWNTSLSQTQNIVGGPLIGGNYWGSPQGDGFSDTCNDANRDGICDSIYNVSIFNYDYLPLTVSNYSSNLTNASNYSINIIMDWQNWDLNTTNFSKYSDQELSNLSYVVFENRFGRIFYLVPISINRSLNISSKISIRQANISVNSRLLPEFNKSALIEFYNISLHNPQLFRNNDLCTNSVCTNISYNLTTHKVSANVLMFCSYTIKEGPYCGDGKCNNGESCSSCSTDCGKCSGSSSGGSSGGGGGGYIFFPSCNASYHCYAWSSCINNSQYRICVDTNNCKPNKTETRECYVYGNKTNLSSIAWFDIPLIDVSGPINNQWYIAEFSDSIAYARFNKNLPDKFKLINKVSNKTYSARLIYNSNNTEVYLLKALPNEPEKLILFTKNTSLSNPTTKQKTKVTKERNKTGISANFILYFLIFIALGAVIFLVISFKKGRDKSLKELEDYVKRHRHKGKSTLHKKLKEVGWDKETIDKVLKKIK